MTTFTIDLSRLPEPEFTAVNRGFNILYPNPMENFTKYFGELNEKFPEVGKERNLAYLQKMKELIKEHPNKDVVRLLVHETQANLQRLHDTLKAGIEQAKNAENALLDHQRLFDLEDHQRIFGAE